MILKSLTNGTEILTNETSHLIYSIAPAVGGKIVSIYNKHLKKEFLWHNQQLSLETQQKGADYDSNFYGGIDELIPNDLIETIDSITFPDHGELWTTPLQYEEGDEKIKVHGKLELSGLYYSKTIYPDPNAPILYLDYKITNECDLERNFLWKLHAALNIEQGDQLVTGAKFGQVVDPAYSRFKENDPFSWPIIEGKDASKIPVKTDTMDFFYLYGGLKGEMSLVTRDENSLFSYCYDAKIFPYQWYFASYGGFLDHYTAILEPCTSMPMSVNEAKEKGQCTVLQPGDSLQTSVRIYAGEKTITFNK